MRKSGVPKTEIATTIEAWERQLASARAMELHAELDGASDLDGAT